MGLVLPVYSAPLIGGLGAVATSVCRLGRIEALQVSSRRHVTKDVIQANFRILVDLAYDLAKNALYHYCCDIVAT